MNSSAFDPCAATPERHPILLFAYGTLKPGEFYYSRYCEGQILSSQAAIVRGQLFALPLGYPALAEGNDWVQGYLFGLKNAVALQQIDELEEYDPSRPAAENEYERVKVDVFDLNKNPIATAWTYRMEMPRIRALRGHWLPRGWWTGTASAPDELLR